MEIYKIKLPQREQEAAEYLESRRKFSHVKIREINSMVLEFLELHNVKSLELCHYTRPLDYRLESDGYLNLYSRSQIVQALNECKSLTSLTFDKVKLKESTEAAEAVELSKLENLFVQNSDNRVLAIFSTKSLKTFNLNNSDDDNLENCRLVLEFLSRQTSLEE